MRASIFLFLAAATLHQPLLAQAVVQPLPGTTAGDRLADRMRALGANPNDLNALIAAGELSLELDDLSAAAALFARADKINGRQARVKGGMGSILVRSERPGEALRYFALADSYGIDPQRIASDRGLAYDLIGEQERAQREYRMALKSQYGDQADRDEAARRYALSLGISGREAQALGVIDPLLRKQDRGAWRARAFVLAMNGKGPEATRIATTTLPSGMAQGLQPFFDRLPTLPAIDRAFAVHFGEVHTTPERIVDRGMAPRLTPLAPEPGTLTRVAVAQTAPVPKVNTASRGRNRPSAVVAAAPTTVAAAPPSAATVQPTPAASPPPRIATPTQVASVQPRAVVPTPRAVPSTPVATVQPSPAPSVPTTAAPQPRPTVPTAAAVVTASAPTVVTPTAPATFAATSAAAPAPTTLAATSITAAKALRTSEDSILARIIAGLSIPASELDVAPFIPATPPRKTPPPVSAAQVVAEARAKEARDVAAQVVAEKALAEKRAAEVKLAEKRVADKKLADRKAVTDKKALAAKKLADAKAAAEAKEAAAAKKAARANPPRIWVQVAGGANEGDLAKAWSSVKAKAPAVFAGKQAWTTPLRATNRVLAGPFKTDAEARGFVNQLGKKGVSAFTFESDQGQAVTRLPGK
ncbi:SPOR domain-containing protein [uncultured Sphingomonas sp.]|uniref:SPOR domain-containing protein n=1 Tax=uncultured Sphingomonas sp. TaxID=158754 RepID=UPI0035CC1AD8